MLITRVLQGGIRDLAGEKVGTLRIGDIASRAGGAIRWGVRCEQCGATGIAAHQGLLNGAARCQSSTCGSSQAAAREAQSETLASFQKKENAGRELKQRRKVEAVAGNLAEVERELAATAGKVHAKVRERISNQRDDEAASFDPGTHTLRMTAADAQKYNAEQAAMFIKSHPAFYACSENLATMGDYFERNGLHIVSAQTIAGAVQRLREYGLLVERPAPKVPSPVQRQVQASAVHQPEDTTRTNLQVGIDPADGTERAYTVREVALMSSDDYRRCFRLVKSDLVLPTRNW